MIVITVNDIMDLTHFRKSSRSYFITKKNKYSCIRVWVFGSKFLFCYFTENWFS